MAESSSSPSSAEPDDFLNFLSAFMRYRRVVMTSLPEHLALFKQRLSKVKQHDESKYTGLANDHFYRVGLVMLSRYIGPMPMGELSKALDVPLSTATRMVDVLVESGMAERVADPEDRRVVLVALTEEGRELHRVMNDYVRQCIDRVLNKLTAEDHAELIRLIRQVVASMNEASA